MKVDELALIRRQQGGVLLDTNVLLLSLMMATERRYVSEWKRTQQFTQNHMDALDLLVSDARVVVTTPHILTEVTNLADKLPSHIRPTEIHGRDCQVHATRSGTLQDVGKVGER